jgi:hypothetical protein
MRTAAVIILGVFAASTGQAQPSTPTQLLNLACNGQAAYTDANFERDKDGHYKDDTEVQASGRIRLRVDGASVRVKLPSTLPGGDAWRDADEVVVNADQISGRVKINLLSRSRFVVNRHSGDIELKGALRFNGVCEKAPDDSAPAKF